MTPAVLLLQTRAPTSVMGMIFGGTISTKLILLLLASASCVSAYIIYQK